MKRFFLLLCIMFFTFNLSYAQNNIGVQKDCLKPDCYDNHGKKNGNIQYAEPVIVTPSQAKNAVEKHISALKGYSIESVESFSKSGTPMISYRVYVKDKSDNTFYYHVNPWGNIKGPIAYTITK